MPSEMEQRYQQRLDRYVKAMRNEKPDRVPIRPFVAEFTAKYAGYTIQEVTQDYQKAFAAARKCAADFDWDAVVGNMVYVWSGLTQAIGLRVLRHAGRRGAARHGLPVHRAARGRRPGCGPTSTTPLIEDPTGYLFNVWLPRVSRDVSPMGQPTSFRNNLSFLKGGMAMLSYFNGFGTQAALLRSESGTPWAISGILKAPLRHPGRQAPRLQGAVHGHVPPAEQGAGGVRGDGPAPVARGPQRGRSGQERADRPVAAPRLRALPLARASSSATTGRR